MAFTESRAEGGRVAFSRSILWTEAVCGPSFGYLRFLGPYGFGSGWLSILRTVFRLMPVSRTTCVIETPSRRIRRRMPDHCTTSRYMTGPPSTRACETRADACEVLGCAGATWMRACLTIGVKRDAQPSAARASLPRLTFSMMPSGSALQTKGLGHSLASARKRFMAAWRSTIPLNTPRLSLLLALGRKNALFAGSESGARTWAILASLINTAKLNDLDPQTYLADVLERMISGRAPVSRLDELLAWNWKAAYSALATAA